MLKNYLKITFRNLIKHRSYSLINIFGLTLGATCCLLIFAYIGYELSFDRFHSKADSIYRLITRYTLEGATQELPNSTAPLAPTLVAEFPEVLDAVRFSPTVIRSFKYQDKQFFEDSVFYVGQSFFNIFSFELIEGDPETALEVPFTMVLTEDTAKKYFGEESPVGKIMNWDNRFDYRITGVVKNPPANSHYQFKVMASYSTYGRYDPRIVNRWSVWGPTTYVLLAENTDLQEFKQKLAVAVDRYYEPVLNVSGGELEISLQPLKDIYLNSRLPNSLGTSNDIRLIRTFAAIALLILCIACFNFMNLATARSSIRAKEVGMRKVLGADRKSLIFQFLGESFVFSLLSLTLAVVAAQLFLPFFNRLASREIVIDYIRMPWLIFSLLGVVIFVAVVAGSYPALFLSQIRPAVILKGSFHSGTKKSLFRSALVVSQFSASVFLIIFTVVIFNQQKYMRNKDLGFDENNVLVIALQDDGARKGLDSFRDELSKVNGVAKTTASSMVPGELYLFNNGTYPEGASRDQMFMMDNFHVDHDFLGTFEIEVVKGRGFSKEIPTDVTDAIMINETAARQLGWENPVGKTIHVYPDVLGAQSEMVPRIVIGVFKDIHQRNLYSLMQPTYIQYYKTEGPIENRARRLSIRLETDDLPETMKVIEQKWKEMFPDHPYYFFFLDEFYHGQHGAEQKLGNIFRTFSVLAVVIGCLGLLGLASFTAEQRTKEIGIRKVLGSTVGAIVILLSRKFVVLVTIANGIAWPIAYFVGSKWLQNFPYPVRLGLDSFILTALLTLAVALLTVGYQALRAALANPVESLRYE